VTSAVLYGRSALRIARRRAPARLRGARRLRRRLAALGHDLHRPCARLAPGFVDLDEVQPWKAAIPELSGRSDEVAAASSGGSRARPHARARARAARSRADAGDELCPAAALRAYPSAVAVHVIRDGRDVATSLLERGWLSADGRRRRRAACVRRPRPFWVEPGREPSSPRSSDATRAAWAWRAT
jgi:hypothetical protein